MQEENVKKLFTAVWVQALKDLKSDRKNAYLRDWIINEGRTIFVPFLSKKKAEELMNEYLSE